MLQMSFNAKLQKNQFNEYLNISTLQNKTINEPIESEIWYKYTMTKHVECLSLCSNLETGCELINCEVRIFATCNNG